MCASLRYWQPTRRAARAFGQQPQRTLCALAFGGDGYHVVLLRAGSISTVRVEHWGTELTVCDPLGIYRNARPAEDPSLPRKPIKIRRWLAYRLFIPDPTILWARDASRNPTVIAHCTNEDHSEQCLREVWRGVIKRHIIDGVSSSP